MANWARAGMTKCSFADVVASSPTPEFASPRRSTVPLLAFWRMGDPALREFTLATAAPTPAPAELHFEYGVKVRYGRGKHSCTDLMVLGDSAHLAIEAKYREPRYGNVANWLRKTGNRNRLDVLRGWLELLEADCGRSIGRDGIDPLPYQLVHRAASACHWGDGDNWLIYQVFTHSEKQTQSCLSDLRKLSQLIGAGRKLHLAVVSCELNPTPTFASLERQWNNGVRDLSQPVISGLLCGRLLEPRIVSVTAI